MIHCLALPLLVAFAPSLSAATAISESFHRYVLLIATPLAVIALAGGRARHAGRWPTALGASGLALMAIGAFAAPEGAVETVITVIGSSLVAAAHVGNWRLRRSSASC